MAGEDEAYLRWVRTLPCCSCCAAAPSQAHHHHLLGAGLAKRSPDRMAMPLCTECHHDIHSLAGRFKGWKRDELKAWMDKQVATLRIRTDMAAGVIKYAQRQLRAVYAESDYSGGSPHDGRAAARGSDDDVF